MYIYKANNTIEQMANWFHNHETTQPDLEWEVTIIESPYSGVIAILRKNHFRSFEGLREIKSFEVFIASEDSNILGFQEGVVPSSDEILKEIEVLLAQK